MVWAGVMGRQKYLNASSLKNRLATFLYKYVAPLFVSFILYVQKQKKNTKMVLGDISEKK